MWGVQLSLLEIFSMRTTGWHQARNPQRRIWPSRLEGKHPVNKPQDGAILNVPPVFPSSFSTHLERICSQIWGNHWKITDHQKGLGISDSFETVRSLSSHQLQKTMEVTAGDRQDTGRNSMRHTLGRKKNQKENEWREWERPCLSCKMFDFHTGNILSRQI